MRMRWRWSRANGESSCRNTSMLRATRRRERKKAFSWGPKSAMSARSWKNSPKWRQWGGSSGTRSSARSMNLAKVVVPTGQLCMRWGRLGGALARAMGWGARAWAARGVEGCEEAGEVSEPDSSLVLCHAQKGTPCPGAHPGVRSSKATRLAARRRRRTRLARDSGERLATTPLKSHSRISTTPFSSTSLTNRSSNHRLRSTPHRPSGSSAWINSTHASTSPLPQLWMIVSMSMRADTSSTTLPCSSTAISASLPPSALAGHAEGGKYAWREQTRFANARYAGSNTSLSRKN
mmetsp:Transcript_38483/g.78893  ORF Transcript_38483/g.78893 Transcript_38483/m.78893 type:complete len:292 (-) Transcript_38483:234-1109(-)